MGNSQPSNKKNKGKNQKSKSKAQAHAQDAYAIAAKQVEPERLHRRGRDLELDPERNSRGGKHSRDEEDDDEDEEEEDERPQKKRARQQDDDDDEDDSEGEAGSDSDGNEWHIGVNGDDDDSELDSDEAFGDSDDEKFEGYTFRGSRSQKKAADDSDDEDGDDGASLGSDAIDLAAALDQSSDDEDDEGSEGDTESGSEEEDGSGSGSDDDEDVDPSKLGELHNLIKDYANNNKDAEDDAGASSKQMISLEDLGLSGVKDPLIKKALKLMKKEEQAETTTKKGLSKKLDVPLPRRQQDQLLRAAAYEKTNETLDRWNETVKHNRRADHLIFPLPQNAHDAGLDNQELLPLTKKTAGTELEQTIMSIMEESGLGPKAKSEEQAKTKTDANGEEQTISRSELKDLWAQRRKDRELQSREQTRAKRIKKIKSKTYRRIHRKERLGDEADQLEQMRANGEINSDEEREAAHRRRALERVGAKHKESKWAKMGSKVGRAVWDDDYRAGLTDMARRNEELRRRVEGKGGAEDDGDESDASSVSGDEDGTGRLLKKLEAADEAEDEEDHPHSGLLSLKFMQRAEAQRRKENDELVAEIRRELGSGSEPEEDDTEVQVGRRTFGLGQDKKAVKPTKTSSGTSNGAISNGGKAKHSAQSSSAVNTDASPAAMTAPGGAGQWASTGKSAVSERKKGRKAIRDAEVAELELAGQEIATVAAPKKKAAGKKAAGASTATQADGDDSSDDGIHLPLALRDHELVDRAFAGEDVAAEFEAEKAAIMSEDDEKIINTTMPGWGSWTGDGISKRAQKRNKGNVTTTKKNGIKKKDRKDAKLDKVILNEKRNRKVRWSLNTVIIDIVMLTKLQTEREVPRFPAAPSL